jgi:hypothetical protein
MAQSQAIGAAGELIVQARLLVRGWITGNVNSGGMMNAPAVDLVAMKAKKTIKIAVKSTGHNSTTAQWAIREGANSLYKGDAHPDFVIFVWFVDPAAPDLCRTFVVSAQTVSDDVLKAHRHFHSRLTRAGTQPKGADHVVIRWNGRDTERSKSHNFAEKWKKYEDAWELLER